MALQSIHDLEKEIHSAHDISEFSDDSFRNRIKGLSSTYSTVTHLASYQKVIRELNTKYKKLNLSSKIIEPVDAGLRPTTLTNFMA